ncbi:MAG: VanZ family protein [Burkholderiales bacterium]|jgi:VanZ family protein|nr:VanZ family protein [Burkholderiales bacterium]
MPADSHRSHLPLALALLYTLCIIYASLYPFMRWEIPLPETPYWLLAPTRFYRADFIVNFFAYLPFGLFVGLACRRYRLWWALVCGALLALAMESCQWLMPPRHAGLYDFLANAIGAASGGVVAWCLAALPPLRDTLYHWRHLFLSGWLGDFGLALLVFWLAAQANPGIPLFSIVFDPTVLAAVLPDNTIPFADARWSMLAEVVIGAFQISGIGLFAALLMCGRRHAVLMAALLILAAFLLKNAAIWLTLSDTARAHYLGRTATWVALALGFFLLYVFFRLSRPKAVTVCAVILLSSLLAPLLLPDLLSTRVPPSLFNDRYAHLLHFDGLTRTILLGWPLAAGIWLFFLAGRPRWGESSDTL